METPNFNDREDGAYQVINKIWQEGWGEGHKAGFRLGHKNGRSVMNQGWTVFAVTVSFLLGMGAGYFFDFVNTCVPVTSDESKSCVTRVGE